MNYNYLWISLSFILLQTFGFGQSLSSGDIAIIGVSVDNEEILIVALEDISAGEIIFFTDDEWNGSTFNTGEGFYEWVTPNISIGTVVTLTTSSSTAGGTVTQQAGNFALGNSGDGVFLYQTSTNVYNTGTYNLLAFAGEDAGDAGTLSGSGLTLGTNAIYFGGDNGIYTGTRTGQDKVGFLTLIYNNSNWVTSGSAQTFTTTNFTVTTATAPTGVTTGTTGSVTATSAIISGNDVTSDGGATITERGVVYGTSANPLTADNKQVESGTTGTFNATLSGLNSSTTYYARAFATNSVGTTYGADVTFTTNAPAGDTDSDIIENSSFTYTDNIDYTSYINSGPLTTGNSLELAQFTIRDGGSSGDADALTTTLTNLELNITNHANLNRIALFDGSTNVAEVAAASSVSFSGLSLQAADNGTKDFSIRVSFQSTVTDNQQISATVATATAQAGASLFNSGDAGGASSSSTGDKNRIEVNASQLAFVQQPSNTNINTAMAPAVTVEAIDANNNRDLDYTNTINLASTGTLTGAPVGVSAVSGLATFSTLTHTAADTGLELSATSGLLTGASSNSFDVIQPPTLLISEVADPSNVANAKFIELYNYGATSVDLATEQIYIARQANGGSIANIQLSGTIQANSFYVVAYNSGTFSSEFGFSPDETNGSISGNGDDGYFLYYGGNNTSGTLLDAYGVLNQDGTGEAWEYTDSKAIRNTINTTTPNVTWTASEWTITGANTTEMSPGTNENEFIYNGEWRPLPISNASTTDDIYIRSTYTTTTSFSANNLEVNTSINLTIANTHAITTAGTLTNNGTITIENTGALIQETGSTLAGSGTYEVEKDGFSGAALQYNFWSSPVAVGSINILGNNRYYYTPSNATVTGSLGWTPASGNMEVGRGYIATNSGSISFAGTVNNGDITFTGEAVTNGSGDKVMNLIGNPYPSGLDLNAFIGNATNSSNLSGSIYFWDDNGSQGSNYSNNGYATWSAAGGGTWVAAGNGGNKISNGATQTVAASCQGFIVIPSASASGAISIEFNNGMRAANGSAFFKTNYCKTWINLVKDTSVISQAVVVNDSKSSFIYDELYDAPRIANNNSFVVNTLINNKAFAINSIPDTSSRNLIVPIEILAPDSANIQLELIQNNASPNFNTWLLNEQNNTLHALDSTLNVPLNLKQGSNQFLYLVYKPKEATTNVLEIAEQNLLMQTNQGVWFTNNNEGNMCVFDLSGKLILKKNSISMLNLSDLKSGIYILSAEQNNQTETLKLFVQ